MQTLQQRHDAFETDARIAHRLLSQRAVQHDAVLATLALLQPGEGSAAAADAIRRLPSVYPQILMAASRVGGADWPMGVWGDALAKAEGVSRERGQPVLAWFDAALAQCWIVQAAAPASYALQVDARAMVPWAEWPIAKDSPVSTALTLGSQRLELQTGRPGTSPWQFSFRKRLATDSQPFEVELRQSLPWSALPWGRVVLAAVLVALVVAATAVLQAQRRERRRAEELLRLGQVARLNAMGELAAGMAHELNQPLAALLANTQAAKRLLADAPPDLDTASHAMEQAVQQARRASDVVNRLRRTVERPDLQAPQQGLALADAARKALYLVEPQCQRAQVRTELVCPAPVTVQADPVALEQIIHNLLSNALQALERQGRGQAPATDTAAVPLLRLEVSASDGMGLLAVGDNGPGIAPEALPHVFEPFFSTREGGLGLGLSLCESLAQGMGGTLRAANQAPQGALFTLCLPLAGPDLP